MTAKEMETRLVGLSARWVKFRDEDARAAYRTLHPQWMAAKEREDAVAR